MVKFWEGFIVSNIMNFMWLLILKGNKFFFLKIEYVKLIDVREFDSKNIEWVLFENEKSSEDFENLEKVFFLNNDYFLGNFICFFVLLFIKDGVWGIRRFSCVLRFLFILFGFENGFGLELKNGLVK